MKHEDISSIIIIFFIISIEALMPLLKITIDSLTFFIASEKILFDSFIELIPFFWRTSLSESTSLCLTKLFFQMVLRFSSILPE